MEWSEILLIDKPVGITSFDVIRRLRRLYSDTHDGERAPKMGHAGTLDPLASGLMIIGCGTGTKRLTECIKLDKEYITEILIGESRTTGDQEGEVMDSVVTLELSEEAVREAVAGLVGVQTLPVSAYSAIKKDGVPMYKRARAAAKVGDLVPDVPWREMKVYEAEVLEISAVTDTAEDRVVVRVRFKVASGTYIRSLGEELGRRLGYPACLYSLRRTEIGDWRVEDANPI